MANNELATALAEQLKNEQSVPVSIRLTKKEQKFLQDLADKYGTSISKIIHVLLAQYM